MSAKGIQTFLLVAGAAAMLGTVLAVEHQEQEQERYWAQKDREMDALIALREQQNTEKKNATMLQGKT
jgi:hypothetical protein